MTKRLVQKICVENHFKEGKKNQGGLIKRFQCFGPWQLKGGAEEQQIHLEMIKRPELEACCVRSWAGRYYSDVSKRQTLGFGNHGR